MYQTTLTNSTTAYFDAGRQYVPCVCGERHWLPEDICRVGQHGCAAAGGTPGDCDAEHEEAVGSHLETVECNGRQVRFLRAYCHCGAGLWVNVNDVEGEAT